MIHAASLRCAICRSALGMPSDNPAIDGDWFVCPGCIGVNVVHNGECHAAGEAEITELGEIEPELIEAMDARRIELAKGWAENRNAPTLFASIATLMYEQRGPDSLRLPRK